MTPARTGPPSSSALRPARWAAPSTFSAGPPSRASAAHTGTVSGGAGGYGCQIEMTYRGAQVGGRIVEVPIKFVDRVRGTSKMSTAIIAEAMALVTWWGIRDRVLRRR